MSTGPSQEPVCAPTLAQLSQTVAPKWARMDPSFVMDFIRDETKFAEAGAASE
ncbi:hypothetical protein [Pseudomonas sp. EL_65y_Pfl1_R32]|uniref:hypothetical protein n=1 Tax=Pseudomonas sp. EL_65y_Pfl1_R32 TaxID=3088696 RepID=UPI0030DCEE1B